MRRRWWYGALGLLVLFHIGCATLFGWNIHAPGVLSERFFSRAPALHGRLALYPTPAIPQYISHARGDALADPMTFYVGEALGPMLIEAFQAAVSECVVFEIEPTPALLKQYAIPYVVLVDVVSFDNRMSLKGQIVSVKLSAVIRDQEGTDVAHLVIEGSSDGRRVFSKKGGPEVNLNAALEDAITMVLWGVYDTVGKDYGSQS